MHLLAITPGTGFEPTRWKAVLNSGIDALMIREKHLEARALLDLACRARDLAPGVTLWVNGRLDVALAAGCGCHAPEAYPDLPPGLTPLSRPLHALEDFPSRGSADQLLLSPVFPTPGKGAALGVDGLRRWLDELPPYEGRLLALGGITAENAMGLRHARLGGVALIRALWEAPEPEAVVARLKAAW